MHLYIGHNYIPLKGLLIQHSELAKFNYLNVTDQIGINVWLIYVISYKNKRQLLKVLKISPLRFDSQLYEFYDQTNGKLILIFSIYSHIMKSYRHSSNLITIYLLIRNR